MPEVGSRAAAERLLDEGGVVVDGERRPKSHRLEGGEEVELTVPEPASSALEHEDVPLRIAYEDEHVLVVDKPAGVVVHPSPGHASGTLVHGLVGLAGGGEDEERPGIVHRLDRDTSGLLRQVSVDGTKTYFDTNVTTHHHYYLENSHELVDIEDPHLALSKMPEVPEGYEISRIDMVVRLRKKR